MGIATYNGGILVAGGTSKDARKPVLETVLWYDPTKDGWFTWKSLPSPRAFCSLALTKDNRIFVIAGAGLRDVSKRKNSSLPDILSLDEQHQNWSEAGTLLHPRHGHSTVVLGWLALKHFQF